VELENPGSLAVACFLLCHGANLDAKNQRHVSPIMHIVDCHVIDVVRQYARFLLQLFLSVYEIFSAPDNAPDEAEPVEVPTSL